MPGPPQDSLALEEALQAQQALLPLRPVGAGAVVQDLCHVFRLTQVVWDAAVPGAVGAFRAGARGVTVGVVVGIHAR